ncbi:glycosyltransferase family 2 protein [Aliiglaciecola sp. M165]|uniref:glycosyltransferase family 2 protein n=1 Tax=Aliiglaciecola sp. M165 TaxID=2593649 RepID=UPI001180CB5B|nr:glycosyltransferase family 2 protein [Aliiglaciecola sp. M165]TRY30779.1 glycosyltransferase family 2 protein [Aliiglaciecola sp. M165]
MKNIKKLLKINNLRVFFHRFGRELEWFYTHRLIRRRHLKVKIVAIAKNEACYLPEWLAHHLSFGFDHISVYVNNTDDNTEQISAKLASNDKVEFLNGDVFFKPSIDAPQVEIYRHELKRSREQKFSHVFFLDIDEFWTPKNLDSNIHQHLQNVDADVVCFEWVNRCNENESFLPALQSNIEGVKGNHVKSAVGTHVIPEAINPHNVYAYKAKYSLADGSNFSVARDNYAKIRYGKDISDVKPSFVLHRMYRSQEEYVALLLRGRPIQNRQFADILKTNRGGYVPRYASVKLRFEKGQLERYRSNLEKFLVQYDLLVEIETAKPFVQQKRKELIELINSAPKELAPIFKKILNRVTLSDVVDAHEHFKKRHDLL